MRDIMKPKDENEISLRCSVFSKTIGTLSTKYRLREGKDSLNTGESFIEIGCWRQTSAHIQILSQNRETVEKVNSNNTCCGQCVHTFKR